jgi:hypothetical protein
LVLLIIPACSNAPGGINALSTVTSTSSVLITTATNPSQLVIPVPTSSQATPFVVQDNQITYGHENTLNCEYVIGGQILDMQGEPFDDAVVNINLLELEGVSPSDQVSYSYPSDGQWSALLPNMSADYEIWLTKTREGESISPYVIVSTKDCNDNSATVNFIQIAPLE